MKKIIFFALFVFLNSAFSANDCKFIYKSEPIKISVFAQQGRDTVASYDQIVSGKKTSQYQSPETFIYGAGALFFSLSATSSCKEGVEISFKDRKITKHVLVPWDQTTIIDGEKNSTYMIQITASTLAKK